MTYTEEIEVIINKIAEVDQEAFFLMSKMFEDSIFNCNNYIDNEVLGEVSRIIEKRKSLEMSYRFYKV